MNCQQCSQRPASVHVKRILDGQVQELHLCEKCAAERGDVFQGAEGFTIPGLLAGLLAGLGGTVAVPGASPALPPELAALRCPRCGHSYLEFSRTGLLGCPECYDAFSGALGPLIRRIHGKSRHEGKFPARGAGRLQKRREADDLRRQLASAVAEQAFERAAELRDRIREIEAH